MNEDELRVLKLLVKKVENCKRDCFSKTLVERRRGLDSVLAVLVRIINLGSDKTDEDNLEAIKKTLED